MWSRVRVATPPAASLVPITVDELKTRLEVHHTDHDTMIENLRAAAISVIDGPDGIGYALMTQTWTLVLDAFTAAILLPGAPIASVTQVRFRDTDGNWQAIDGADWEVALNVEPAVLTPVAGTWPATKAAVGAVEVNYELGKADPAEVDHGLVTAIGLMVGDWYMFRENSVTGSEVGEIPFGASMLMDRHRRHRVAG